MCVFGIVILFMEGFESEGEQFSSSIYVCVCVIEIFMP